MFKNVKFFKRIIILSSVMMMLFSLSPVLFAHESSFEPGALTSPPPPMNHVNNWSKEMSQTTSSLIQDAWNHLNNDNNSVQISATTFTNFPVEQLSLTIYLERWDGTRWNTISSGATTSDENKMYLSGSQNYNVIEGYYYRGRTIHMAKNNSVQETKTLYTHHVLVPL